MNSPTPIEAEEILRVKLVSRILNRCISRLLELKLSDYNINIIDKNNIQLIETTTNYFWKFFSKNTKRELIRVTYDDHTTFQIKSQEYIAELRNVISDERTLLGNKTPLKNIAILLETNRITRPKN